MRKQATIIPLEVFNIERSSPVPLHRQLYNSLRRAILSGQVGPGMQLPSTRLLATELALARGTVANAFAQLQTEGYLESKYGGGTYVARELPEDLLQVRVVRTEGQRAAHAHRLLSRRGELMSSVHFPPPADYLPVRPFRAGLAALDAFPLKIWAQLVTRRSRQLSSAELNYGDPAGLRSLREALAGYLGSARGVNCQAEQIIIVSGSQQALDLTARLLLDPGDATLIEDPCYLGAYGAFVGAGARPVPIPVDQEGMQVASGIADCPTAIMAYVTPSHQYPLGVTMSLPRRLALLEWARTSGAWILEDDYDSEFRYTGRPLPALQGLDLAGRTIYLGTFSKVLFPALRLGYLVVPPDLVDGFLAARTMVDFHPPAFAQAVLTDFITEGHFGRHIRCMRELYAERQAALVAAAGELADWLEVQPCEAGMYLIGRLPTGVDDLAVSERARMYGIEAAPLSIYRLKTSGNGGLLLGYTAFAEDALRAGIKQLARAWSSFS